MDSVEELLLGPIGHRHRKTGAKRSLTPSQRAKIILKVNGKCLQCKKKYSSDVLELHHIKPVSEGGSNRLSNITVLCPTCHRRVHTGEIPAKDLQSMEKYGKLTPGKKASGLVKCTDCEYAGREFGAGPYWCSANGILNSIKIIKPRKWRECLKFSPSAEARMKYRRKRRKWQHVG